MVYLPTWDLIEEREGVWGGATARLEIPGGWLYRVIENRGTDQPVMAVVFVPIPERRPEDE
jgi:hypothetical protein